MELLRQRRWHSPRALLEGFEAELREAFARRDPALLRDFFRLPLHVVDPTKAVVAYTEADFFQLIESLSATLEQQRSTTINFESVRVRQVSPVAAIVDLTVAVWDETDTRRREISATCTLSKSHGAGWRAFALLLSASNQTTTR